MRACRKCHALTNKTTCQYCSETTSDEWQGYMIIIDAEKSKIAQKVGIKNKGKYALKVR
ncbi:MAG: DNA-directed RNA polymerase subunit E'' [Thermoplasmatales archaeon]|nr:DNA-directed RNA polymerase subunit E'' [Thermoplasmatales archaeon]